MKRTRDSVEQIVSKLREADAMLAAGRSVAQIAHAIGVSEPTYALWRSQYGGMKADEARRLKELELENARLKRLTADQAIDIWPLSSRLVRDSITTVVRNTLAHGYPTFQWTSLFPEARSRTGGDSVCG
jgi:putative transposase